MTPGKTLSSTERALLRAFDFSFALIMIVAIAVSAPAMMDPTQDGLGSILLVFLGLPWTVVEVLIGAGISYAFGSFSGGADVVLFSIGPVVNALIVHRFVSRKLSPRQPAEPLARD